MSDTEPRGGWPTLSPPARAAADERHRRLTDRVDRGSQHAAGGRVRGTDERHRGALASDEFTGRSVGTTGGAAARAWLSRELTGVGVAPHTGPFAVLATPTIYRRSADTRPATLGVAGRADPVDLWLVVRPA